MKKLVLMKYLNNRDMPCYRRITEKDVSGTDDSRLEMANLEKNELIFSGKMKKHLWTKLLTREQYRHLMDEESKARIDKLDTIIKSWENT